MYMFTYIYIIMYGIAKMIWYNIICMIYVYTYNIYLSIQIKTEHVYLQIPCPAETRRLSLVSSIEINQDIH